MKKTIIIKLGGAAITEKHNDTTISPHLHHLLGQIKHAHNTYNVILIHGAGGYGHPTAKQYGLKSGWSSIKNQRHGFALTRSHVLHLHHQLLDGLLTHAIPVISVSPFEHVTTHYGQPSSLALANRVQLLLKEGFVPLLFGDAVLDSGLGCTILSGDVTMLALAQQGGIERCIFLTDVAGVYTANPKTTPNAHLIRQIQVDEGEVVVVVEHEDLAEVADVTGGMQGKIACARQIVRYCPQVLICQTLEQGALDPVLSPEFHGTVFTCVSSPRSWTPFLLVHALAFTLYYITPFLHNK